MAYKYLQIRDKVINQAKRTPGNRVPSEHEICRMFAVSRTTAIKALNSLAADKLVRREVGRGTFLVRSQVNAVIHLLVNRHDRNFTSFANLIAPAFSAANPDVDVRVDAVDATQWVREIITRPGMKVACASHVGYLSDSGILRPLHDLPGFEPLCKRLLPYVAWRTGADGKALCDSLPLMLAPDALLINLGLAEELGLDAVRGPADWAELADWAGRARRVQRHGQPAMGASIVPGHRLPLSYLLSSSGCRHVIRAEGGRVGFDSSGIETWLSFFHGLHHNGAMPLYPAGNLDPVLLGNALFSPWGSTWAISQQRDLANGERLAVQRIPPVRAGQRSCCEIGGLEVALVRNLECSEAELDAAWRLVRFMVGDQSAQRLLVDTFSCLSVLRGLHEEQCADPRFRPFIDLLEGGVRRSDHPLQHPLLRIVHAYFHRCVLGDLTVARAAERIAEGCALQIEIGVR
ncbi:MAG: extracellular solute-binding protein [Planctomycetes bacterium]|nr:extracellular solute-binding protein [Planctomycetota bacterium]